MAWATSVGAHWEKTEAEYNAEWTKLAYLDGPGYTAWDQIEAKFDLQRKYFSGSSSHGVQNSIEKAPIQTCSSHFISSMAESNREHNLHMAETAREIRESCARILKLLQKEMEATKSTSDGVSTSDEILLSVEGINEHSVSDESVQVKNFIMTSFSPSIDFNGGIVDLPKEITQKLRKTPESCVGIKVDVKITFADSFISEHPVVDSDVERDWYNTKVTPLDMDRKQNNSPVIINQGVFNPSNHLSDPPDLVPVPPPPLAPPWLPHSVYLRQLDSPPLIIESNNSFQLDQEVVTRIPSQIDNSIALQVINMLRKFSVKDTSVISNVFLLSLYACPIVSGFSGFGPSVSYTYQLFVERPLKITFFWNIALFQLQHRKCAIILYLANILLTDTPKVEREGTHFSVLDISNKALLLESNVGGEYKKSSYCPQHHMLELLDFTVLVEAMDSCVLPSYHFVIPFNSHNMISISLTSEYMQMTMKGKHSMKFDYGGTGYFFLPTTTLLFQQWDPGGWSSSLRSSILLVLKVSWRFAPITQHQYFVNFNLEDKVDFNGGSNVMTQIEEKPCHQSESLKWLEKRTRVT
ncbi:uncharacterized protein LOC131643263 isoform X1 [Vicia villosa]|uniref:uncharacterized protein LOC131643263 isoform X1 n=1 Tax=Vicia villosa TaxID=3911 RepID=UPI00273AF947|nr:uncharacterized protein LOC131643263 isoform X1 [Vicia villosa]XP_058769403.1 uncharacterized protein LOC131643263 isoform X1 [Vicia villosa]XP_058769404.1 uncharacterized protein LOC131643263 isoform X1 [Vicia villosa]XP_058769405.1 uncharacterized protein LOC131643263 isoform X1 [Vicia villosa]XP_058769406.1 uncharacterized protein LOC131643263 isoform X1 [Vicia villosa]XP_058769407.1 uncharacterized protein LOC131643263 isoform X1 [Vicia villosa]XP_058769409.1 uncharacterized protein LO